MIKPHAPSSPTRPPVEHLYFSIRDDQGQELRFFTYGFGAMYAAAHWLQRLTSSPAAQRWINSNHLELERKGWRLVIKGSHLEDGIEYKPTKEESAWTPPHPDSVVLEHLVDFHLPTYSTSRSIEQNDSGSSTEPSTVTSKTGTKRSARTPTAVAPRHKTQKPAPNGMITVAQMAATLNMQPNKARQILRKAKIEKPEHGWSYKIGSPEAKKIQGLLAKS